MSSCSKIVIAGGREGDAVGLVWERKQKRTTKEENKPVKWDKVVLQKKLIIGRERRAKPWLA